MIFCNWQILQVWIILIVIHRSPWIFHFRIYQIFSNRMVQNSDTLVVSTVTHYLRILKPFAQVASSHLSLQVTLKSAFHHHEFLFCTIDLTSEKTLIALGFSNYVLSKILPIILFLNLPTEKVRWWLYMKNCKITSYDGAHFTGHMYHKLCLTELITFKTHVSLMKWDWICYGFCLLFITYE